MAALVSSWELVSSHHSHWLYPFLSVRPVRCCGSMAPPEDRPTALRDQGIFSSAWASASGCLSMGARVAHSQVTALISFLTAWVKAQGCNLLQKLKAFLHSPVLLSLSEPCLKAGLQRGAALGAITASGLQTKRAGKEAAFPRDTWQQLTDRANPRWP